MFLEIYKDGLSPGHSLVYKIVGFISSASPVSAWVYGLPTESKKWCFTPGWKRLSVPNTFEAISFTFIEKTLGCLSLARENPS